MPNHNVIIGGGPVATNAVETIRQFDDGASRITLVSDEPAHSRMALPYWLAGQIARDHTMTADDAYYAKLKVEPRIGVRATKLDPQGKSVTLSDGSPLGFDNLLIATGSSAIPLPVPGADLPGVQSLWTLAHTESVLDSVNGKPDPSVVMIGSGFIGFIMLNAMNKRGWKLAVVEREPHVLPRMLNADAAGIVEKWLGTKGIELHCGTTVSEIRESGGAKSVVLGNGQSLPADIVIIATGVQPNVDLVKGTDIKFEEGPTGGIYVNDRMQTNHPFIYAGGDVAKGPALFSEQPTIHGIQPTAVDHGRIAGAVMAGQDATYPGSLSMNVLDICGLQCASFGNWSDSSAQAMTISNAKENIFRTLLWTGEQLTGAIFVGAANDMGMLTDVGMVKGLMQTQTDLGQWKTFLAENPFDIRRPYVATKVAQKLVSTTLLGRPSRPRQFQFKGTQLQEAVGKAHAVFVGEKKG